jgi:alpha-N-arabinofuranosidase
MKVRRGLLACLAAFLTGSALAREGEPIRLPIDPSKAGPKIDRHIFGQFAEHLGRGIYEGVWVGTDSKIPNTRGIRNDVVAALKALRVPNVRWPGGCFADEYHWRNGIGPSAQRPPTLNPNWGGVIEPNTFGTHEFMDFAEQIGAEAYLSVNVGSGTPQEAAEWLEYMTTSQPTALAKQRIDNGHPEPFKVPFLGIGNESWGCGGSMSADYYVSQLKIYARYARSFNAAQPMRRIAVGPDGEKTEYTEAVMKAWKDHTWAWNIEGLSLHFYTLGKWPPSYASTGFGETEYVALLKDTQRMDELIRAHGAIMDKYDPEKTISLVVDEWGAWLAPTPGTNPAFLEQQNSQRDAVIAALNIHTFVRHADRVRMANIAQMVNVLQAMIFTNQEKLVLTPTYHVFHMYVPFQDATSVPIEMSSGSFVRGDISLPRVDAIAARDAKGKLWVAVINLDPTRSAQVDLAVAGSSATRAHGTTLIAPRLDGVNTFDSPTLVAPRPYSAKGSRGKISVELAPASVTVIALE